MGSFTSPGGAPPKMKTGHVLPKIKKGKHDTQHFGQQLDPLRFASSRLPQFQTRHRNTNNKHDFHATPARPPAGRLARRTGKPNRGSGKEHRAML